MNPLRKILNFFFSSIIGGVFFTVIVAGMLFFIANIYLVYHGTDGGNIIEELQPLAVLIIGLASVLIAASNYWEKLGHNITCRLTYNSIFKRNRSAMPYIINLILINKKNKVEIIDKILFYSKKLGYTTVADFSKTPLTLKNYETKIILLDPVTVWASGISKIDIVEETFASLGTGYETKINTIREGANPIFYFTHHNYLDRKIKIAKMFAVNLRGLIPVKIDRPKYYLQSAFPIRNTDYPNEDQEEKAIYGPRVIMVTELTLSRTESGKEPENKEIKVLLYNNEEKFCFDSYIEENINTFAISLLFGSDDTDETMDFEKEWQKYYANEKIRYKKFLEDEKNKEGTPAYAEKLENFFHDKTASLLLNRHLPRISSKITSRIFFLREVQEFGGYPIVKRRHTLFATGFYPTEEAHACFEKKENIFTKIRKWWSSRKTPASSQKTQEK